MPAIHKGPYSAGYLNRFDEALAASPALTTTAGDEKLATLLRGRRFASVACKPAPRLSTRAEPLATPGGGSSLTGTGGGGTGIRHGTGYSKRGTQG